VAKLVTISVPDAGSSYQIDATEVTAAQYSAWKATSPTVPPTVPSDVCSWKTSYSTGSGTGNYPVADVDWCDAYAYCKGVGKRLCGKIGGGANGYADVAEPTLSQWYNACSSGGKHNYAYGGNPQTSTTNGYDGQKCNGADKSTATMAVGTCPDCTSTDSGYTGVYDLSGNVWEWEDSCNGASDEQDSCRVRGGLVQRRLRPPGLRARQRQQLPPLLPQHQRQHHRAALLRAVVAKERRECIDL
jgi:sulfatase modifying factor 1